MTDYGVCSLCMVVSREGPAVQLLTCQQCRTPLAVARDHVEWGRAPASVVEGAKRALLEKADAERLNGMFDDRYDRDSATRHYRAHWRPLLDPLSAFPQDLANAMTMATQEAVKWFHNRGHLFLGDGTVRAIPDDEVRQRIMGMQYAMDKEVYQTVGHGGQLSYMVDPETGKGYDKFLEWHERYERESGILGDGWNSYSVRRYDLSSMPAARQRALVERWERLHLDYLAANPELAYDPSYGYLRHPYRIFDATAPAPDVSYYYDGE